MRISPSLATLRKFPSWCWKESSSFHPRSFCSCNEGIHSIRSPENTKNIINLNVISYNIVDTIPKIRRYYSVSEMSVPFPKAVISLSVCTCTHVRIGTVRMFMAFFFSDGHLCFFLIFFVILLAGGVSVCACTHVRMCSPLILA